MTNPADVVNDPTLCEVEFLPGDGRGPYLCELTRNHDEPLHAIPRMGLQQKSNIPTAEGTA